MINRMVVSVVIVVTSLMLSISVGAAESSGFVRVDFDGSYVGWMNYEHGLLSAEVLGSSDGWLCSSVGLALQRGNFTVYPMVGFEATNNPIVLESFLTQLLCFYENSTWEIGSWTQRFNDNPVSRLYLLNFATFKVPNSQFGIGPFIDGTFFSGTESERAALDIEHDQRILAGIRMTINVKSIQLIGFIGQNVERRNDSTLRIAFRSFCL